MAEYIDREALIKDLIGLEKELFPDHKELGPFDLGILQGATFAITKTKSISAADVQPVKHGRWINICGDSESMRQCSECLQDFDYIDGICYLVSGQRLPPYCPNCGATMDGEDNG